MARKKPVTVEEIAAFSAKLEVMIDEASDLGNRIRDHLGSNLKIEPQFLTKIFTAIHDISELGRTASIMARNNDRATEIERRLKQSK